MSAFSWIDLLLGLRRIMNSFFSKLCQKTENPEVALVEAGNRHRENIFALSHRCYPAFPYRRVNDFESILRCIPHTSKVFVFTYWSMATRYLCLYIRIFQDSFHFISFSQEWILMGIKDLLIKLIQLFFFIILS